MKSSWNPLWPHYAGFAAVGFALLMGLLRRALLDGLDGDHCGALMTRGRWLDYPAMKSWQPDGCMLHTYKPQDASICFGQRDVAFIGDSVTRKLFYQFVNILDPKLPTAPPDDHQRHVDHSLQSSTGTRLSFYWDPFLNTSQTRTMLEGKPSTNGTKPALLVLGAGLWNLRYADISGGIPAWEANIEDIIERVKHNVVEPTDRLVILPVQEVVTSKLSPERASTMRSSDIHAMNSDLFHRVNPTSGEYLQLFTSSPRPLPASLPIVFNEMLDPSRTEDGLHFDDDLVKLQANILFNLRCNSVLPKKFPFDKTCCRSYPWPDILQTICLLALVGWGPYLWLSQLAVGQRNGILPPIKDEDLPSLVMSAAVLLIFLADRTGLWLKEQKAYSPWTFGFLCLLSLGAGLGTVRRVDKDLGFLNREQTDEWKGWMQIVILIYHYVGASKISGIYNPIRVCVASYLFMTGYGHATYYIRKADFSFLRVAQVLVRLNLLTFFLAYTMNTDYISYYFSPLVSMWFLIIYATMILGSQYNDHVPFLVCKLLLSAALVTWFFRELWLLESVFSILSRVFAIHWSAREWAFRVNLDLWIVYVGMFTALATIKLREHRLTGHSQWPLAVKTALGCSGLALFWFFIFELTQESKFTYNLWHPYISLLPVLAFAILRNANVILRSASSRAFAFIGRCSLETFIIQFHFWLAADSKGVLLVLPGTKWRPLNFIITSIMFIYISHRVAQATGAITMQICGSAPKTLPLPATTAQARPEPLSKPEPMEEPAVQPRGWADRLAQQRPETPSLWQKLGSYNWASPGLKGRLSIMLGVQWILNILWVS
ncbi:Cas1p-domain-containing protein [Mycena floridula]|nr:Cas1p-domain-containing protein [Mycena floridula]